jgi:hypothetical protein
MSEKRKERSLRAHTPAQAEGSEEKIRAALCHVHRAWLGSDAGAGGAVPGPLCEGGRGEAGECRADDWPGDAGSRGADAAGGVSHARGFAPARTGGGLP